MSAHAPETQVTFDIIRLAPPLAHDLGRLPQPNIVKLYNVPRWY